MNELISTLKTGSIKLYNVFATAGVVLAGISMFDLWATDQSGWIGVYLPCLVPFVTAILFRFEKISVETLYHSCLIAVSVFAAGLTVIGFNEPAMIWSGLVILGIIYVWKDRQKWIYLILAGILYSFNIAVWIFDLKLPLEIGSLPVHRMWLLAGIIYGIVTVISYGYFFRLWTIKREKQYKLIRDLFDHIPTDIVALDRQNRHIYLNKLAIRDDELREWMIGKTMYDYCRYRNKPFELAHEREANMNHVWQTGESIEWEETYHLKEGDKHHIRKLSPAYNEKGELSFLVGYGFDITHIKNAEIRLAASEAFQKAINYFSTSLFKKDTEESILADIASNCIGYLGFANCEIYMIDDAREFLLRKARFFRDGEEILEDKYPFQVTIDTGIAGAVATSGKGEIISDTSIDPRYYTVDEVNFSELVVPIRGEDQKIMGVIVSEHKEKDFFSQSHLEILTVISSLCANKLTKAWADQNMLEAKERAEEATMAKSRFLSTMSHEIRTPLNAVIGISHLLLEENPLPEQEQSLKTLQFSSQHLLSLINDVLDFSKIDSGRFEFDRQQFNLETLLHNIQKTFSFQANEKGLDLMVYIPHRLNRMIWGDMVRLNQILTNLVGNAMKFTSKGSVVFGYEIEDAEENAVMLKFLVMDTGIGIPTDKQEHIFEQFAQASADTTRKFGGTGLGLAISKKLVELQDGEIGLESEPEKGTRFWFTLKYETGDMLENARKEVKGKWTNESLDGMKILLVEDNKVNVMVASKFLKKWKADADIAYNGKIAVDMTMEKDYDLILMDLNMPVMDGIDATHIIRSLDNPVYKQIPIIALTADASTDVREMVLKNGMNGYVTKPFNPDTLFNTIRKFYRVEV